MAKMRRPKISRLWKFLILFCLCYFLETITFTYLMSAVQSIERQFQIPSRMSGTLVASSDIGYILTAVLLAHFGSKGNRARWIGGGCLLISFACLLVALPSFIFPPEGALKLSINNETLGLFQLPRPLVTFGEVDTAEKFFSHPHLRCTVAQWFAKQAVEAPRAWNISTNQILRYSNSCTTAKLALSYDLPAGIMDRLDMYVSDDYDFPTFAYALEERLNGVAFKEPSNLLNRQLDSFRSILKMPQATCSRLSSALRAFAASLKCQSSSTNDIAFSMVFIGIMLIGVGHSMPWTLGMPLIDDNVKKNRMPFYTAGIFFIRILGPVLGFMIGGLCNRLYYNLSIDVPIEPTDVNWIGAWWLGFLIVFTLLLVPSLMLFCFPHKDLKKKKKKHDDDDKQENVAQTTKEVNFSPNVSQVQTGVRNGVVNELKEFSASVAETLKSPIYTLTLMGRLLDAMAFKGFFVFQPKYLQAHYGLAQYKAVISMGLLGAAGFATGSVVGSVVMRKLKLDGRRAVLYVGLVSVVSIIFNVVKMTLSCNSTLSVIALEGRENEFNFTEPCNSHCNCDNSMLFPVCSESGKFYFSPCHAACHSSSRQGASANFTDCFCIDTGRTVSSSFCNDDCSKPMTTYFIIMAINGLIGGTAVVPGILIVLRSVKPHLKSVALGFSAFLISLLSTFPSPIIYGYVIDETCLLWSEHCGQKGSCSIYDTDKLRMRYFTLNTVLKVLSLLFDLGVLYWAKDLKLMETTEQEEGKQAVEQKPTEKTEEEFEKEIIATRNEAEELTCCTTL